MPDNQHTTPVGRVVTRGDPICKYERQLDGAVKPGMLVGATSNEYIVKKVDETIVPFAWAGFETTPVSYIPESIDSEYRDGDIISVLAGGNFEVFAFVTGEGSTGNDITIYPGMRLVSNGDGTLKLANPSFALGVIYPGVHPNTGGLNTTNDPMGGTEAPASSNDDTPSYPVAIAQEFMYIPKSTTSVPNVVRIHALSLI